MGLSQPAVSSLIRELERALGDVTLLDRSTRTVQLTEAGRTTLLRAELVIAETTTLVDELRGAQEGNIGTISLACTAAVASSVIPGVLRQFKLEYPNWRHMIHDVMPEHLVETVLNGTADFGIGTVPSHVDLNRTSLASDVLSLVMSAQSPLAGRTSMRWEELADLPTIAMRKRNVVRPVMDGILAAHGADFHPFIEVTLHSTALALAAEGIGYAILPPFLIPERQLAEFAIVPLASPTIERELSLFSKKNRVLSPAAKRFGHLVETRLREMMADRLRLG
jgi:DNA-binding transcriptional LysR family regulator